MTSLARWRRRHGQDERGATIVELAFILPLFVLLIFGLLEFGLMFRERMTFASATQSAARTGATLGTSDEADYRILQALEAGLIGQADPGVILGVDIFQANPATGEPLGPRNGYSYDGSLSGCKWDPCPGSDPRPDSLRPASRHGRLRCVTPSSRPAPVAASMCSVSRSGTDTRRSRTSCRTSIEISPNAPSCGSSRISSGAPDHDDAPMAPPERTKTNEASRWSSSPSSSRSSS